MRDTTSRNIPFVVRDDLATWQKLNVTASLTSGIVGAGEGLLGGPYEEMPPATPATPSSSSP